MENSKPACVVTTINAPTEAIESLSCLFPFGSLIVVGDKKTPADWKYEQARFLGTEETASFFIEKYLPFNHYSRKNIGYLYAMTQNASVIYDTDDDNIPNETWRIRDQQCSARMVCEAGWCNVYKLFSPARIWPRGFSLNHVNDPLRAILPAKAINSPIQQGLSDENPDVDAIWRLTTPRNIWFEERISVALPPGAWCPFNSQSTWWWPKAYPLMYLPVTAPFRMTDIWRSFVAQRCLWETNSSVVFHSPSEVIQKRNVHCLLKDFEDEIPGYLNNHRIVEILEAVDLKSSPSVFDRMLACYLALVENKILLPAELNSLEAWFNAIST